MSPQSVVDQIVRAGGVLKLEGDRIKYRLPERVAHLADDMKRRKPELVELLRKVGGRIATFPHCPRCASYVLYRKDNIGAYECQTCGLGRIEEATARQLM